MKDRLYKIRKKLKLTQDEFGKKIELSKPSISALENGTREITERTIKLICSEFSVNEHWFRTGEGNIFVDKAETTLAKAAELLKLDDIEQRFLSAYLSLDQEQRQNFKEFWRQIAVAYNSQDEIAATIVTRPAASDRKLTRAQKEELMKQQLDAEEKRETLLASTITNGFGKMA